MQKTLLAGGMLVALTAGLATQAAAQELVITVERIRALDRIDPVGQADFFAQVTIDGEVFKTERIRR
ncbi:MAG: hypothetical protein AB7F78_24180, partial [Hyphomicrobiaceae bacterium]